MLFQIKRLKLRRNNWETDTYEFDEVLTEFASQKRVYEVVAKPVVEVRLKSEHSSSELLSFYRIISIPIVQYPYFI